MTTLGRGFSFPISVAVDSLNKNVYVGDYQGAGIIYRMDVINGEHSPQDIVDVSYGLNPSDIAVDESGDVYVSRNNAGIALRGNGVAFRLTWAGGTVTTTIVSSAIKYPCGIAVDAAGKSVFVVDQGWPRSVRRLNSTGGALLAVLGSGNLTSPVSVAVDATGTVVYILDRNEGVFRMNGMGGDVVLVSSDPFGAWGMALDGAGNVYLAAPNTVYRMNSTGGSFVALVSGFDYAQDVAVDAQGRNVYVVDRGAGAVYRLQPPGTPAAPATPPWPPLPPPPPTVECGTRNWSSTWFLSSTYHPRSKSCKVYLCGGSSIHVGATR